ncbi:MAG: hypothetical protein ACOH2P_22310, partial [Pseudomonas sp.]
ASSSEGIKNRWVLQTFPKGFIPSFKGMSNLDRAKEGGDGLASRSTKATGTLTRTVGPKRGHIYFPRNHENRSVSFWFINIFLKKKTHLTGIFTPPWRCDYPL